MSNLKKLKPFAMIISIILASVYLTFLIDVYTLNTWLKRAFIFCYFLIMSCIALYIYSKSKTKHKYTAIPLLCALTIVILCQNLFLPTKSEHTIYLQAVSIDGKEEYKEVWLTDVTVDEDVQKLSAIRSVETTGWSYSSEYDDYFFAPAENNKENILSFTVVGEEVVLRFGANTWSGSVRIFDNNGYDEILYLYSENAEKDNVTTTLSIAQEYSVFECIIYSLGAAIVLTFGFKALLSIIFHFVEKRKTTSKKEIES